MKSYLLMHKKTGNLVEATPLLFGSYTPKEPVFNFEYATNSWRKVTNLYEVHLGKRDGWIVNNPDPAFGGLWFYMPENAISREWVVVGEV